MAPLAPISQDAHTALLAELDMQHIAKPFRAKGWKPPARRNKNLRQMLSEAQKGIKESESNYASGVATPVEHEMEVDTEGGEGAVSGGNHQQGLKQTGTLTSLLPGGPVIPGGARTSYTALGAAPSLKPKKKFCDITGLPTRNTDPKTGLNYYNAEIFQLLKTLSQSQVQHYLSMRGANTILK
ncbi:hypothetical protein K470DRAFT_258038 [Piedraia hortae CBS 480.64]|uniref:Vps72/YL1 C-terminal domain-containing protein n=1 Tax=Piedraia hortae CBS 480.64 TaxID=1314780 RepID=A0A6A7BYV2_9PEZI|nr:hypothetical protein K470DRAFT_258038 [Piedraia hortae CBS 480.64]